MRRVGAIGTTAQSPGRERTRVASINGSGPTKAEAVIASRLTSMGQLSDTDDQSYNGHFEWHSKIEKAQASVLGAAEHESTALTCLTCCRTRLSLRRMAKRQVWFLIYTRRMATAEDTLDIIVKVQPMDAKYPEDSTIFTMAD